MLEEKVKELDIDMKKIKDELEKLENKMKDNLEDDSEERRSLGSQINRGRSSCWDCSMPSEGSEDRLSIAEVGKLKKWMTDREKEERRNNIVSKGIRMEGEEWFIKGALKKWVTDFLKDKLGVVGKVE